MNIHQQIISLKMAELVVASNLCEILALLYKLHHRSDVTI